MRPHRGECWTAKIDSSFTGSTERVAVVVIDEVIADPDMDGGWRILATLVATGDAVAGPVNDLIEPLPSPREDYTDSVP